MFKKILLWIRKHVMDIDDRSPLEVALANGMKMGKDCNIQDQCILDPGHCFLIELGDRVTLAPRVHLLAHDASTKRLTGYTRIGRVRIGNNVFIGAGTIVLPNVEIGDNVIIGAGSVVSRSIPSGSVAAGCPARIITSYDEFKGRTERLMAGGGLFDASYKIDRITPEKKKEMIDKLDHQVGFIV